MGDTALRRMRKYVRESPELDLSGTSLAVTLVNALKFVLEPVEFTFGPNGGEVVTVDTESKATLGINEKTWARLTLHKTNTSKKP